MLRALVIGTGSIGQRHMRSLHQLRPDTKFVLLRRSDAALQGWPDAVVETDLEAALATSPNMAIVASPSAAHIDVLPRLIAAGVPCYVEKPIVTDSDDVVRVRSALSSAWTNQHSAGFNLRYLPSLVLARQATQHIGEIVRVGLAAGQWLPDWRKGTDHRLSYSAQSAQGGGVMFDLSHEFDAARFLLGEIDVVSAQTARVPALEIDSEAVAVITGRAASGALVNISVDYVARKPIRRYELVGTKGTLVWDLAQKLLILTDGQ